MSVGDRTTPKVASDMILTGVNPPFALSRMSFSNRSRTLALPPSRSRRRRLRASRYRDSTTFEASRRESGNAPVAVTIAAAAVSISASPAANTLSPYFCSSQRVVAQLYSLNGVVSHISEITV